MYAETCVRPGLAYNLRRMITGRQIRAACALLNWTLKDLSDRSGVAWATVQRMQKDDGFPAQSAARVAKVQQAFENSGVLFTGTSGVNLREDEQSPSTTKAEGA